MCVRQYDCVLKKFDRVPPTPPPTNTQPCISVHLTESRNYLLHSCDGQHCSETTALETGIIPTGHVMTEHLEGSHTMRTHMNTDVQTNTHTYTHPNILFPSSCTFLQEFFFVKEKCYSLMKTVADCGFGCGDKWSSYMLYRFISCLQCCDFIK